MKTQVMRCPFCKHELEVDVSWAIKNGLIFCGTCCKSFPVRVGEDTEDKEEPPPIPETIEEKFDKGVQEILGDDDEDDFWDSF